MVDVGPKAHKIVSFQDVDLFSFMRAMEVKNKAFFIFQAEVHRYEVRNFVIRQGEAANIRLFQNG
jgi:hypothetical protein